MKKCKTKLIAALLAALMISSFAGCTQQNNTQNSKPENSVASAADVSSKSKESSKTEEKDDTSKAEASKEESDVKADSLSLWTDSAPLKSQLTDYIKTVTDENSADFIPVENRIAVFDMDGTLCCETDPGYFDHKLLYHRVMEDPDYKDKASKEEKETAAIIKTYFETGEYPSGLDVKHGTAVATAFKGMTIDEFDAYVKAYRDQPMEGYAGMTNGQAFYKPMLEVVDYLI